MVVYCTCSLVLGTEARGCSVYEWRELDCSSGRLVILVVMLLCSVRTHEISHPVEISTAGPGTELSITRCPASVVEQRAAVVQR